MSDEQFQALCNNQRQMMKELVAIRWGVMFVLVFTVIIPVMRELGWYGLLQW
jgi:hypothetical protein